MEAEMLARPGRELQFRDRREAGRVLSERLREYADRNEVIVLGLPRGGVPVAYAVARALNAPLDVFMVRKLGVPGHEELAMGAIASGGARVLNENVLAKLDDSDAALARVTEAEMRELERREVEYRSNRPAADLCGKTVILVDDGLATGATMRVAVMALRDRSVASCVVAVPVAAPETCAKLRHKVDDLVCVLTPAEFMAVGQYYEDFSQITDHEVRALIALAMEGQS
jgi:putative phosphoribosyl transferase